MSEAKASHAKVTQKELNEKFDGLKTILKNIKSAGGKNLYEHLQEVFQTLILHYPESALEKIEEVSFLIKHGDKLKLEDYLRTSDMRNYAAVCEQMRDYIAHMQDKFPKVKRAAAGEDEEGGEEEAVAEPVNAVPDLLDDASSLWQWAGVGFGQQELYRL